MNRGGIEGLPFKYIIIAVIAALVLGILVNVTQLLGDSVISGAASLNETLAQALNGSLG